MFRRRPGRHNRVVSGGDLRRCNTGRRGCARWPGSWLAGAVLAVAPRGGPRPGAPTAAARCRRLLRRDRVGCARAGPRRESSPCAQYDISVPPLAADKTQMRQRSAPTIRALGPGFHALAEVDVHGVERLGRQHGQLLVPGRCRGAPRMAAAGFDVAAGDSWAVNELSSAVRTGTGASRQNIRDLVHGLYDGDGGPACEGCRLRHGHLAADDRPRHLQGEARVVAAGRGLLGRHERVRQRTSCRRTTATSATTASQAPTSRRGSAS